MEFLSMLHLRLVFICSTKKYIKGNGELVYDMSCMQATTCNKVGYIVTTEEINKRRNISSVPVIGKKRQDNGQWHLDVCIECCETKNCNRFLCDSRVDRLECLSCNNLESMSECAETEICGNHEVCYVQERITDQFKLRYDGGCLPQHQCDRFSQAVETNGVSIYRTCINCCKESYCNYVCKVSESISTTVFTPTTTEKQTPTKSPMKCELCSGNTCGKIPGSGPLVECSDKTPWCITKIQNLDNGERVIHKGCASDAECNSKWWEKAECIAFHPSTNYTFSFTCSYCCTTPRCNTHLFPDMSNLVAGGADTISRNTYTKTTTTTSRPTSGENKPTADKYVKIMSLYKQL